MADELRTDIDISFYTNTGIVDKMTLADSLLTDYDTDQMRHGTQTVTTTSSEFVADGMADVGNHWWWFINRDDTNNILLRAATGEDPTILLRPGEIAGFRMNGLLTMYVDTESGTAVLEYFAMGGNS
jgi:hypothetical protein